MARDDAPQTVGEAVRWGWTRLIVWCGRCRRCGRIALEDRPRHELLTDVAGRVRCRSCGRRGRDAFDYGLADGDVIPMTKPISFHGDWTVRVGML